MRSISNEKDAPSNIAHDLKLRYKQCYFNYQGSILRAVDFYSKCGKVYIEALDRNNDTETVEYCESMVNFKMPKLGYINVNGSHSSIFLERKSIVDSSYKFIRGFTKEVVNILTPITVSIYDIVEELHNPTYPSIETAIEGLYSGNISGAALSSNLSIEVSYKLNRIFLYHRCTPIGVYVHLLKRFRLFTNTFNRELIALGISFKPHDTTVSYVGGNIIEKELEV